MEGFINLFNLITSREVDCEYFLRQAIHSVDKNDMVIDFIYETRFAMAIVSRKINSDIAYLNQNGKAIYIQGWISPIDTYPTNELISLASDKSWSANLFTIPTAIANFSGGFQAVTVDKNRKKIVCFSDRTASRPIYYAIVDNLLILSSNIIWILSVPIIKFELDLEALVQFVRIQTILENRTLYKGINQLPNGSFLTLDEKRGHCQVNIQSYWKMAPLEPFKSDEDAIEQTAQELSVAGKRITKGNTHQQSGILLSGGMDSRAILSVIEPHLDNLSAFTFGLEINPEIRAASKIAKLNKIPWNFCHQTADDYLYRLNEITPILQGKYSFAHANTFKTAKHMSSLGIETIFHGGLMDPFMAGSYLPKEMIEFLGFNISTYRLATLPEDSDVVARRLLKSRDIQNGDFNQTLLEEKFRDTWEFSSINAFKRIIDHVSVNWSSPYDWFDKALVSFGFSDFYTYPVTSGIRLFAKERSVLYESNIIDLYLRLSIKQRFLGHIYRRGIRSINKNIAEIIYPNIGISPFAHPFLQAISLQGTAYLRAKREQLLKILSSLNNKPYLETKYGCYPDMKDIVRELLQTNSEKMELLRDKLLSCYLVQKNIISIVKLKHVLEPTFEHNEPSSLTLLTLLSLSNWLDKYPAKE